MKPPVDIKILPVEVKEFNNIAAFLQKFFFEEEPLNSSLGRNPTVEDMNFKEIVMENMSFKAINSLDNSEDNLLGVVLNQESSIQKKNSIPKDGSPEKKKIFKLLNKLDEKSNTWEVVNNENHFHIVSVSVNNKYRGLKIGLQLVEESLNLGKSLGYKFATVECSSYYSAKFVAQMGFELLGQIVYDEYLDENNEQVFKVKKPHTSIQKFLKRL